MFTIELIEEGVRVYNDGILILEAKDTQELRQLINVLIEGNEDRWEVEILENILYTINNNLSTQGVA